MMHKITNKIVMNPVNHAGYKAKIDIEDIVSIKYNFLRI
jgi:hypothetical protein